jgi:hypothetical protein
MLSGSTELFFLHDRAGTYLDCHAADPGQLLLPREQLLGRGVREVLPAAHAGQLLQLFAEVLADGAPVTACERKANIVAEPSV